MLSRQSSLTDAERLWCDREDVFGVLPEVAERLGYSADEWQTIVFAPEPELDDRYQRVCKAAYDLAH